MPTGSLDRFNSLGAGFPGLSLTHYEHCLPEADLLESANQTLIVGLSCFTRVTRQSGSKVDRHEFRPGEMSLVPAGQSGRLLFGGGVNTLHIGLSPDLMTKAALASELPSPQIELVNRFVISDPQLLHVSLALRAEQESGYQSGRLYGESLALALAGCLLTRYTARPNSPYLGPTWNSGMGLSPAQTRRTLDYIQDNLSQDLSLAEIAKAAGLGASRFKVLFKQSIGLTPHQYVIEQRVRRAERLLLSGKYSVGEAALMVGFYDQSHLNRHFKRFVGMSPKLFLRRK